jgi:hypothetical protein
VFLLLLTGCITTWSHQGLAPGELRLPADVHRVAVVDRTGGGAAAAAVVGFSGAALQRGGLELAPTEVVDAALAGDASAVLTAPVGPASALAACARTGAQALVMAHRVTPDPFWNFEKQDGGAWMAHYNARARVGFRVWDCAGRRLHDVQPDGWHTVSAEGAGRSEARAAVPADRVEAADRAAVAEAGRSLAEQLVPTPVERRRPVFASGGLRPGLKALQAGDLAGAHAVFRAESATLHARRRARALHDLAVVAEAEGELDDALDHVTDALLLDPHPATLALRASLMRRAVIERRPAR